MWPHNRKENITYIEDLWLFKSRSRSHAHANTLWKEGGISPSFLSPPTGSRASFGQPGLRGHRLLSGWCGSSWTRASGRTTRVPGGSREGLSAERTGGYSEEFEAGNEGINTMTQRMCPKSLNHSHSLSFTVFHTLVSKLRIWTLFYIEYDQPCSFSLAFKEWSNTICKKCKM